MSQKSLKKYKIDQRTAEDIEELIRKGAASYTPEWHFDTEDPDIGSTIGRIFARQMQENIRAVNHVLDVYQAEFVNLLDLTLERAVPAGTVVVFHLADSGVDGTEVLHRLSRSRRRTDAGCAVSYGVRDREMFRRHAA